jgi:hypothetical protein
MIHLFISKSIRRLIKFPFDESIKRARPSN